MMAESFTLQTPNGIRKYVRITKRKARKLYDKGNQIFLFPVHAMPNNPWLTATGYPIDNKLERDFDSQVSEFEYFNCGYQLGNYSKFFVEVTNGNNKV